MKKKLTLLSTLLFLFIILTGCMQEDASSQESEDKSDASDNETIIIEAGSEKHEFDGPQKNIVALEWSVAEELLAVGVQPAGVADVEGFNKWVTIDKKLDDSVVDVGQRTEPNIEEIAKLDPDVIVGKEYQRKHQEELEKVAPVVLYDGATDEAISDLYAHMTDTFKQTGKLVGKEQEAKDAITHLEERMDAAKQKVEAANLSTSEFVFTQAFSVNQAPTFRLFTSNSTVSHVLEGIGLTNKIQDQEPQTDGFIEANVEALSNYQESLFLHTVQKDDPLFSNLENNQAWNSLAFVKNEDMYDLGAGVWTFGSVLSMETLVDHAEEALVK
ncbi:ABC transporter substrate-binding protein [Virgibacillus salexigens]|uniref:ABC transporter substrate-binding protein n=1 Tax=Virgibacillus salexigens TaxID=61016 RepID=UPI001909D490|nr:iron-siderophore ABC transporter substrate-binding protein [Virgibacillus salexigens]